MAGALLVGAMGLNAQTVTFNFDASANGLTSFQETVGGITITIQQNGLPIVADTNGVRVGNNAAVSPDEFDFAFSSAVNVVGYGVGAVNFAGPGKWGPKDTGGVIPAFDATPVGSYNLGSPINLPASSQAQVFSALSGPNDWFELKSLTITAVPESSEIGTVAAGVCTVVALLRRRTRFS